MAKLYAFIATNSRVRGIEYGVLISADDVTNLKYKENQVTFECSNLTKLIFDESRFGIATNGRKVTIAAPSGYSLDRGKVKITHDVYKI